MEPVVKGLVLAKSINGRGVFAKRTFKRGDVIVKLEGKILHDEDIEYGSYEDLYCIQIGKKIYLGPSHKLDDFINHSC